MLLTKDRGVKLVRLNRREIRKDKSIVGEVD